MKRLLYIALLSCIAVTGYAQDTISSKHPAHSSRDRYVATQFAFGHLNQLDTYLSQEKYRGFGFEFISAIVRDSKKHPLTYTLTHEAALSRTNNNAKNGNMTSGHYDFAYGVLRKWTLINDNADADNKCKFHRKGLTLRAGGFVNADLGFAYNSKSAANNPAQAYLSANIGAQFMAAYYFRLWKKNFRLNYEARIPVMGLMFSPNYGQSYYEIFCQGNYDHNVVFTSIATFQIRQQLTLDIPVAKRTAIRVGYLGDIRQANPNNLKQHQWYNAAIIGFVLTK